MPPQTPRAEAEVAVSLSHEGEPNSVDVHHDEEESVWGELGEGRGGVERERCEVGGGHARAERLSLAVAATVRTRWSPAG